MSLVITLQKSANGTSPSAVTTEANVCQKIYYYDLKKLNSKDKIPTTASDWTGTTDGSAACTASDAFNQKLNALNTVLLGVDKTNSTDAAIIGMSPPATLTAVLAETGKSASIVATVKYSNTTVKNSYCALYKDTSTKATAADGAITTLPVPGLDGICTFNIFGGKAPNVFYVTAFAPNYNMMPPSKNPTPVQLSGTDAVAATETKNVDVTFSTKATVTTTVNTCAEGAKVVVAGGQDLFQMNFFEPGKTTAAAEVKTGTAGAISVQLEPGTYSVTVTSVGTGADNWTTLEYHLIHVGLNDIAIPPPIVTAKKYVVGKGYMNIDVSDSDNNYAANYALGFANASQTELFQTWGMQPVTPSKKMYSVYSIDPKDLDLFSNGAIGKTFNFCGVGIGTDGQMDFSKNLSFILDNTDGKQNPDPNTLKVASYSNSKSTQNVAYKTVTALPPSNIDDKKSNTSSIVAAIVIPLVIVLVIIVGVVVFLMMRGKDDGEGEESSDEQESDKASDANDGDEEEVGGDSAAAGEGA